MLKFKLGSGFFARSSAAGGNPRNYVRLTIITKEEKMAAAAETAPGKVTAEDRADADAFLAYINATPTPFHLVRETATRYV